MICECGYAFRYIPGCVSACVCTHQCVYAHTLFLHVLACEEGKDGGQASWLPRRKKVVKLGEGPLEAAECAVGDTGARLPQCHPLAESPRARWLPVLSPDLLIYKMGRW